MGSIALERIVAANGGQ